MRKNGDQSLEGNPGSKTAVLRICLFLALALAMALGLTKLLIPTYHGAVSNVVGLYDQPRNTTQVIALGASTLRRGFSPDYLYSEFGICSYNCCTASQHTFSSYYMLREALDTQSDSISLLVMDASPLLREAKKFTYVDAERVTASMRLSTNKAQMIVDALDHYVNVDPIEQLVPLFRYHSRWGELSGADFDDLFGRTYETYSRGQEISDVSYQSNRSNGSVSRVSSDLNSKITEEIDYAEDDLEALWSQFNMSYFDKIVELCNENEISILLVKTGWSDWDDMHHDSAEHLACTYGIPFLDMNQPSVWSACGLSYETDYFDSRHPNLAGSLKITDYLGNYLKENYQFADTRGDVRYEFMDTYCNQYSEAVEDLGLSQCTFLGDYLDLLARGRYTAFVALRPSSEIDLDGVVGAKLGFVGLSGLFTLEDGDTYAAVIAGLQPANELSGKSRKKSVLAGAYSNGVVTTPRVNPKSIPEADGVFVVESSLENGEAHASVKIGGTELADDKPGLNFVVYDRITGCLVDSSSFELCGSFKRTSDV